MKPGELKKPVVVESFCEEIILSENEVDILTLGPKYNLYSGINEENLEVEVEEMIMKVKWDMMGDKDEKTRDPADIAMEVALGKEECDEIDREIAEELEIKDAESRAPFNKATNILPSAELQT